MRVLTELRNRGIKDVLFVCCDSLCALPEAIEATSPKRSCRPASSTSSAPRCGTSPTTTARRSPPRCALSTPPSTRPPPKTRSSSCAECTASATPACWPPVTLPVRSSSRSCNSTPRSASDLHHQRHLVHQLPAAEDHQEPRALPLLLRRDQAALPLHPQHHLPPYLRECLTLQRCERRTLTLRCKRALNALAVRFCYPLPVLPATTHSHQHSVKKSLHLHRRLYKLAADVTPG